MPTYDIKIFPTFALELKGIEADSPEAAYRAIQQKVAFCRDYLLAVSEADPDHIVLRSAVPSFRVEERGTEKCHWIEDS